MGRRSTNDTHGPVGRDTFIRLDMPNSVISIDSYFSSDDSDDEEYRLAQQEWEESLEQLAQIVSVAILPFLGRWLGRRWSYWGMFMTHSSVISVVSCFYYSV